MQGYPRTQLSIIVVVDHKSKEIVSSDNDDFPSFVKAYAGAGVPANSGTIHTAVIENGNVDVAGNNDKGQLCLEDDGDDSYRDTFHQVPGLPGQAEKVAVGDDYTLILLENGDVYSCGTNKLGEIGREEDVDIVNEAVQIDGLKRSRTCLAVCHFPSLWTTRTTDLFREVILTTKCVPSQMENQT